MVSSRYFGKPDRSLPCSLVHGAQYADADVCMRSGDDPAGLHHPEGRGQRLLRGLLDLREGEEARTNLPRDDVCPNWSRSRVRGDGCVQGDLPPHLPLLRGGVPLHARPPWRSLLWVLPGLPLSPGPLYASWSPQERTPGEVLRRDYSQDRRVCQG